MKGEDILAIDRFYAVIPAYEPDEKMLAVIDDISSLTDFHIIVINDGSGKDKLPIFAEAAKKAIVLTHEVNKGKGRGIKTALEYIKEHEADTVGIVIADADGQHKVEDIIRVSEALKSSPDKLIMGCRRFSGKDTAAKQIRQQYHKICFLICRRSKGKRHADGLAWFFLKAHTFYAVGKR